jgi:hypothetical protein
VLFDLGMVQEGFKAKLTSCLYYRQYSLESVCDGVGAGEERVQIKLDLILDASKHTYCDFVAVYTLSPSIDPANLV